MKKNLVVIYGGKSTEHDISILSAIQLMSAVDKTKYDLYPVYITNQGEWFFGENLLDTKFYLNFDKRKLKEVCILPNSNYLFVKRFGCFAKYKKIDCVIISCHGKNGEDGTIQGLLELANIPYQSSGVDGSAIGLDKSLMKQIFAHNKIPITQYVEISKSQYQKTKPKTQLLEFVKSKLDFPVVTKPNKLGSSIGISICKTDNEFLDAIKLAFLFDEKVIVEKCVENLKEVNISVLGDGENCVVSQTEEIKNTGLLSFDKKYISSKKMKNSDKNVSKINTNQNVNGQKIGMQNMDRIIPANITTKQAKQIDELAVKIFRCTNSKGVVRIDFMIDTKTGKVYANEINTIPGSFAFYLWEKQGTNFSNLVDKLVDIAEKHNQAQNNITSTFDSSVLNQNQINIKK